MEIAIGVTGNELKLDWMVQLNEEIKKVINLSFGMNMVALNAMLVAKSVGGGARGFSVVSSELRTFSGKLRESMNSLGLNIFGLINKVAAIQKQTHERDHMNRAMKLNDRIHELMSCALLRKDDVLHDIRLSLENDRDLLLRQVRRTLQLCDMGTSLARSAKIESVYGGDMTATLKQVAGQIEVTIEEILSILFMLESRLATTELS